MKPHARLRLLALLLAAMPCLVAQARAPFPEFVDPHPATGNQFGATVVPLSTGNVVITSPYDDAGGTDAGAVYLFNGATGALISTLTGSNANDRVGLTSVTALTNGNFVVVSLAWKTNSGAVTWGSGTTGVSGVVGSSNSLIGNNGSGELVGNGGVTALTNGNYVVSSTNWLNPNVVPSAFQAGAVTWGSGTTGVKGVISSSNSLVGTRDFDQVGSGGIVPLNNGNYVVRSPLWSIVGGAGGVGAVTWGSGTAGVTGAVSSSNSLVGSQTGDAVGTHGVMALSNGNFLVRSGKWNNGAVIRAGALTWGSGTTGVSGAVSSSNSLVGSHANDQVGSNDTDSLSGLVNGDVVELSNGNYVVATYVWDNGTLTEAGAVTWGSGSTGVRGVVSSSNSLVGSHADDRVGTVTALTNGNYVVASPGWNNGSASDAGAVTWGDGTAGVKGTISSSNSLVGGMVNDAVGGNGVVALTNGNYVVSSSAWNNGGISLGHGAVTWGNGTTGIKGNVSSSNSLVGTTDGDKVGLDGVVALTNGNYVVRSSRWSNSGGLQNGAVTWGNGTTGITGSVSISNSLVGVSSGDFVGGTGVVALSNGNYVVRSSSWRNGAIAAAGAVTWGNGSTGIKGAVSASNSLVGSKANDQVGSTGVVALSNGNYVVRSSFWDNGTIADAGAVTWGSGTTGVKGAVSSTNSLVGSTTTDKVGSSGVVGLSNGNYVVRSALWDNGSVTDAGAVTWGSGATGVKGVVSSSNSLIGSAASDQVGSGGVVLLSNGNYVVHSPNWDNAAATNAGAVTFGTGTTGAKGTVSNSNSALGLTASAGLQSVIVDNVNGTFFGRFRDEGEGKVRLASQINGLQPDLPTISSPTSTAITITSATLGGNVTNDGGAAITERGVVYAVTATNNHPQIGGASVTKAIASGTTGVFTVAITTLSPGTDYTFAAYATNSAGTTYTTPATFTTVEAPRLVFQQALTDVNEEAGTVQITLVRTLNTIGAVSVKVNSAPGTATIADYTPVVNYTVDFLDGQSTATVPVTILPDALAEANESFILTLSDPQGGVFLGAPATTTLRIIDTVDSTKPTVTITAPAAGANVNEGGTAALSGTATDNKGVKKVQFSFNGAAFTDVAITLNATGTTATYTTPLTPLVPGPNSVAVKCIDTRGNESVVTRGFNYIVKRLLTVIQAGAGSLTKPFPGNDATKQVGFTYTIKATPGAGYVFNGWGINDNYGTGITPEMMELPTLTFIHQENLFLVASFIPNPFTPGLVGKFSGLVQPNSTVASNETVGLFSATVTGTGSFTGTLKVDGLSLPVTGTLDNVGIARFGAARATTVTLPRPNKPGVELELNLDMLSTPTFLGGKVLFRDRTGITGQSDFHADRAAYSTTARVDPLLAATAVKAYTVAFKHRATQPGFAATDYPQGDGYATVTIKNEGTVTLTGKLADHTALSQTVPLSQGNTWPLFNPLYASLQGSFSALMTLATTADTDLAGSAVHWFRPYQNVQWYLWGWPEGIDVEVVGARYTPPALPGLLPVDTLNGNATLTFADGLLSGPVTKNVNIHPTTSAATRAPTTDTSYTFTLVPASGLISGTFTHSNATKPAWQGVLMQKGANKGGYGYFMTVSPKVIDGTGVSGGVKLLAK